MAACESPREQTWRSSAVGESRAWHNLPKGQLNESTINLTRDSVNDLACCEQHFLLLYHFKGGRGRRGEEGDYQSHAFGDMPQARRARLWFDGNETGVRKTLKPCLYLPLPVINELAYHFPLFHYDRQCTTPKLSGLPPVVANMPEPKSMAYLC